MYAFLPVLIFRFFFLNDMSLNEETKTELKTSPGAGAVEYTDCISAEG